MYTSIGVSRLGVAHVSIVLLIFSVQGALGHRQILHDADLESTSQRTGVYAQKGGSSRTKRPFLALKDTVTAASKDVERLYEQGASLSAIAYLLFGAAEPFSKAEGSSGALLPYLAPTILRLFASHPERCSSDTVRTLYDVSLWLYGDASIEACHYTLYTSLRETFSWVAGNIALRPQTIEGQPLATATWPDPALHPAPEFSAAVLAALSDPDQLADTAELLAASCGLAAQDFAALVPNIAKALAELHADINLLQNIAEQLHDFHWSPSEEEGEETEYGDATAPAADLFGASMKASSKESETSSSRQSDSRASVSATARRSLTSDIAADVDTSLHNLLLERRTGPRRTARNTATAYRSTAALPDVEGAESESSAGDLQRGQGRGLAAYIPANFFYDMPPDGFVPAPPASMPSVLIPLVFHIMLYQDTGGVSIGPSGYGSAGTYVERLVRVANFMGRPTGFSFFVREVRNDPDTYPYLMLASRSAWLSCGKGGASGGSCLYNNTFVSSSVADFPRSINVFVSGDGTNSGVLGYAWVPGSDVLPSQGFVFMTWDGVSTSGTNSLSSYNDGPNTLLHEAFHHLGLKHTFTPLSATNGCDYDDYIIDTPTTWGFASVRSFAATSTSYCMELFWGQYGGDWDAAYARWSTTLGIPETDMNAWADSCPTRAGYDELGNYMTYNTPVCFAALGHFTPGQVQRVHYVTSELNPVMYAWGQYYATKAAPPPAGIASPPPEAYTNICKATRNNCACKATWTYGGSTYSYCDSVFKNTSLACEVADAASCSACSVTTTDGQCIMTCAGSPRQCKRTLAPGTNYPPPPPPRLPSPPPMPPPPPPHAVLDACKVAANGCACRSAWISGDYFYSYCASPDGTLPLRCQVNASCPSFNVNEPTAECALGLTAITCSSGPVHFSTTYLGPSTPILPPSPMLPPSPPTPISGSIARISGSMSTRANCTSSSYNSVSALTDILAELAKVAAVPSSYIVVSSLTCFSTVPPLLVAKFIIYFPPFTTPAQLGKVILLLASPSSLQSALSATFKSQWGTVNSSSYWEVVLMQRTQFLDDGPYYVQRLPSYDSGLVQVLLPDGDVGLVCNSTTSSTTTSSSVLNSSVSSFGAAEASTVCRQLGFSGGSPVAVSAVSNSSTFGSSPYLDGLSCNSSSLTQLLQCRSRGWVNSGDRCNLGNVVGVSCTGGVVASLDADLVLQVADCSGASVAVSLLLGELFTALANRLYKVPVSRLVARQRLTCNGTNNVMTLTVPYAVQFPLNTTAAEVDAAQLNGNNMTVVSSALGSDLLQRWGTVASATTGSRAVVLQRAQLCITSSDSATRVCTESAPDTPSSPPFVLKIVLIVVGSVVVLGIVAAVIGIIVLCRKRRTKNTVQPLAPLPEERVNTAWLEYNEAAPEGAAAIAPPPVSPTAAATMTEIQELQSVEYGSSADLGRTSPGASTARTSIATGSIPVLAAPVNTEPGNDDGNNEDAGDVLTPETTVAGSSMYGIQAAPPRPTARVSLAAAPETPAAGLSATATSAESLDVESLPGMTAAAVIAVESQPPHALQNPPPAAGEPVNVRLSSRLEPQLPPSPTGADGPSGGPLLLARLDQPAPQPVPIMQQSAGDDSSLREQRPAPVVDTPISEAPSLEAPILGAPALETAVSGTPVLEKTVSESLALGAPILGAPSLEAPVLEAEAAQEDMEVGRADKGLDGDNNDNNLPLSDAPTELPSITGAPSAPPVRTAAAPPPPLQEADSAGRTSPVRRGGADGGDGGDGDGGGDASDGAVSGDGDAGSPPDAVGPPAPSARTSLPGKEPQPMPVQSPGGPAVVANSRPSSGSVCRPGQDVAPGSHPESQPTGSRPHFATKPSRPSSALFRQSSTAGQESPLQGDDGGAAEAGGSLAPEGDMGVTAVEPVEQVGGAVVVGSGEMQGSWVTTKGEPVLGRQVEAEGVAGVVEVVRPWDGGEEAAVGEEAGDEKLRSAEVRSSETVRDEAVLRRSEGGSAPGTNTLLQEQEVMS